MTHKNYRNSFVLLVIFMAAFIVGSHIRYRYVNRVPERKPVLIEIPNTLKKDTLSMELGVDTGVTKGNQEESEFDLHEYYDFHY